MTLNNLLRRNSIRFALLEDGARPVFRSDILNEVVQSANNSPLQSDLRACVCSGGGEGGGYPANIPHNPQGRISLQASPGIFL